MNTFLPAITPSLSHHNYGIMGPLSYFRDKLKPHREERKRRKSYDDRYRRDADSDSSEVKILNVAGSRNPAKKNEHSCRSRTSRSEGNLGDPRESREIIITPGDRGRRRNSSPRKSDNVLAGRRSKSRRRYRSSNSRVNQQDIPPMPAIPPKWTQEARKNAPLRANNQPVQQAAPAPVPVRNLHAEEYNRLQREAAKKRARDIQVEEYNRLQREATEKARNVQAEEYNRLQREAAQKKAQKSPVDWDRLKKERDEQEKSAAEAQRLQAVEMAAAGARRWGEIEKQKKQKEREEEAIRQREKAEKRRKAEEAENRVNTDKMLAEEISRKEAAIRVNEAARLKAFGPPGGRMGGSEPQPQAPAWSNSANGQTDGSGLQAKPLERRETYPIVKKPVGNNGQLRDTLIRNDKRRYRPSQPKLKPPMPAPLTAENLRAQKDNFVDQAAVSELNRPLGDMTRTYIEGFRLPPELESKVNEHSDEEENPKKRGR